MFETILTLDRFVEAIYQTIIMVGISLFLGSVLGIIIGLILILTRPNGLLENRTLYTIVNPIVNILRSLPFIILLVAIIPFTRWITGTSIGTAAAIVPLVVYVAPYISRLIENSLLEVDSGIVEAADAMGATTWQIIRLFLLPEARSSIILSLTTATIGLISATAMAGMVGGGGIGDLAVNYGYNRFDNVAMFSTVIVLIIFVQLIQSIGNYFSNKYRK